MRITLSVCIVLAWLTGTARADIYRWTDENGGVHIGNVPPAGVDTSRIERILVGETGPGNKDRGKESGGEPGSSARPVSPFPGKTSDGVKVPAEELLVICSSRKRGGGVTPYLVDLVALGLAALFAYRGYRQGTMLTSLGLLRVFCAYAGAYLLAGLLGKPLREIFGLLRIIATALAGVLVFLMIAIGFRLITVKIRRKQKRQRLLPGGGMLSLSDRIGGGLMGLLCGAVTVFVLCWLYNLVGAGFAESKQPDISSSFAGRSSRYFIEQAVYAGIGAAGGQKESARQIARLIGQPDRTVEDFRRLVRIPGVIVLMNSPTFRADFLSGNYLKIRYNHDLQRLFNDRYAVYYLKELGVLTDDYRSPQFQDKLAKDLARAGSRMQEAMNDPGLSSAVEELRREGLLDSGRIPGLILNTRFLKIVDRVLAPETPAGR
ncbi:MAG: CvpA family protein [PVC group bacterium]